MVAEVGQLYIVFQLSSWLQSRHAALPWPCGSGNLMTEGDSGLSTQSFSHKDFFYPSQYVSIILNHHKKKQFSSKLTFCCLSPNRVMITS